jgi:hypothetical protein
MATERELGLNLILDGSQPALLEPLGLRLCERLVLDVREGRSPPEAERLAKESRRPLRRVVRERAPSLLNESLETLEVELVEADPEQVTGGRVSRTCSPPACRILRKRET